MTAYSFSAPLGRAIIEAGINPTTLLAIRYSLTTLLLGATLAMTVKGGLAIDRRGFWLCSGIGLINGVAALTFYWSISRLNAALASMLVSVYPLIVLGILALRGEKFTYRNTIRLALGLGGVYLIVGPGGQVDAAGVILAMSCAAGYALHLVLIQWYLGGYDTRTIAFYLLGSMALVAVGFWFFQGTPWQSPTVPAWLQIITLAVISTYLAHLALFAAIRGIGSGQIALLGPSETLLTVLWSVVFLHERLSVLQGMGSGLILLSSILAIQRLRRARPRTGWWRIWQRL